MTAQKEIYRTSNVLENTLFQLINETETQHKIKDSNTIMKPNIKIKRP